MKVVFYARVSTEEEKQLNALDKQTVELRDFINSQEEWILVDEYIDEGKSGTVSKGRHQYNRLFEDLLTDKFDLVVIKDQSRLMRNVLDWYLFLDRLTKNKKQLYMYLDRSYYTPEQSFITGIKAMMAEEYSRDLSKKIRSAAKRSQENGTVYGSNRLLGYDQAEGKLTINEDEAVIVKQIFNWYIHGDGFRAIQQRLTEQGITSSTGTEFSISTLKRMIRNEKYKGVLVSGKRRKDFETKQMIDVPENEWVIIPGGVPAIVSEEVWDKANNILKERRKTYSIDNQKIIGYFSGKSYPLSGKIFCGKCGKVYWHNHYRTKVNNLKRNAWQCSTYKAYGKRRCDNITIKDDFLMGVIKQILFEAFKNQDYLKETMDIIKVSLKNKQSNNKDEIIRQLTKNKKRLNNLLDLMLDGTISKQEYRDKKEQLESKNSDYQEQLASMPPDTNAQDRLKIIEDFLSRKLKDVSDIGDDIVKEVVEKVVIYEKEIDIYLKTGNHYTTPNSNSHGDDNTEENEKPEVVGYASVSDAGQLRPQTAIRICTLRVRRTKKRTVDNWKIINLYIDI